MAQFFKCEALGNDFILIDQRFGQHNTKPFSNEQVQKWCNRKSGIGADGILLLRKSENADCALEIRNSDGSYAQMCGNGLRCVALFLHVNDPLVITKGTIQIEQRIYPYEVLSNNRIAVSLPKILMKMQNHLIAFPPAMNLASLNAYEVDMGNKHLVVMPAEAGIVMNANSLRDSDLRQNDNATEFSQMQNMAEYLQSTKVFKDCNIGFMRAVSENSLELVVYERGVGFTKACGSGACAAALTYALFKKQNTANVCVTMPGGTLQIELQSESAILPPQCTIRMIGSAHLNAPCELRG